MRDKAPEPFCIGPTGQPSCNVLNVLHEIIDDFRLLLSRKICQNLCTKGVIQIHRGSEDDFDESKKGTSNKWSCNIFHGTNC